MVLTGQLRVEHGCAWEEISNFHSSLGTKRERTCEGRGAGGGLGWWSTDPAGKEVPSRERGVCGGWGGQFAGFLNSTSYRTTGTEACE